MDLTKYEYNEYVFDYKGEVWVLIVHPPHTLLIHHGRVECKPLLDWGKSASQAYRKISRVIVGRRKNNPDYPWKVLYIQDITKNKELMSLLLLSRVVVE